MKKVMAVLLVICMILSLAACGNKTPDQTTQNASEKETTEPAQQTGPQETETPSPAEPATEQTEEEPFEEVFLEREEGTRQLTLYWTKPGADIATSDVWIWYPGGDGHGVLFTRCEYGFKCQVNVPEEVDEVGFIVRTGCSDPGGSSWGTATKDYNDDRFVTLEGEETFIYLKSGDGNQYHSSDGGKTLEQIKAFTMAAIISENQIQYFINPAARLSNTDVSVYREGEKLEIASLSSAGNSVVTGIITLAEPVDITKNYSVEIADFGTLPALPTGIFDSAEFIEKYIYDGDDLGASLTENGTTVFKVWAPTAGEVLLRLFEDGAEGEPFVEVPMSYTEQGVWTAEADCGHGTYYTYLVTTAAGTQEAVDPYARAAGANGNRGMVVDLSLTDPENFDADTFADLISTYQDAVIWEVHVRDFSNRISASAYPGKYLAFTERGLTNESGLPVGVDYLLNLGITHVHLQPVYDYATVDETDPDSGFNWGYDPKNYNVPEGSYSTDPYHGEVRINEFKQMVAALHEAGLGVVMDVVYNHTYDANSNLNKIVPYYYYRYTANGANANGSGCGNETASDRVMFRKYMVDSVTYWANEYHIDGFRFDLMALHDIETMQAIEQALHAINPQCIIYGEGWTGGTSTLNSGKQASQANIRQISASEGAAGSIAVFNDAIRDGLKGSVFDAKDQGFINGKITAETENKVAFGLNGGQSGLGASWSVNDAMIINYMSCHDNLTLWDKLAISCPDASEEERLAMNRLGAAAVLFAKGTPFFLAGEEMLRSKDGDENSYMSSDAVNNIDWEALTEDSAAWAMAQYYQTLISLRKTYDFFTEANVTVETASCGLIAHYLNEEGDEVAAAIFNPYAASVTVPEEYRGEGWQLVFDSEGEPDELGRIPARGVILLVK